MKARFSREYPDSLPPCAPVPPSLAGHPLTTSGRSGHAGLGFRFCSGMGAAPTPRAGQLGPEPAGLGLRPNFARGARWPPTRIGPACGLDWTRQALALGQPPLPPRQARPRRPPRSRPGPPRRWRVPPAAPEVVGQQPNTVPTPPGGQKSETLAPASSSGPTILYKVPSLS